MARTPSPHQKRQGVPLPHRDGLGPSRIRLPAGEASTAFDFLARVIATQRYRHPADDEEAVLARFANREVVLRDGTPLAPTSLIAPGTDVFFYRRPAPERPVPYDIDTVYEDKNILVVNKPPFLATMPRAAHITETVTVRLRRSTLNDELTPAHRLDRLTSGLLLLTKRRELRGAYQELFAQRAVHKCYEAIAPAVDVTAPAVWKHHLVKEHGRVRTEITPGREPNATTILRAVDDLPADPRWGADSARYLLEPVTGRTHQLRVQMNAAGAPIIGDTFYPDLHPYDEEAEDFSAPLLLSSVQLRFVDPITGKPREFETTGFSGLPL